MLNRRRFVVGAALIAVAVAYLVWAGISSTAMYYFELDEFLTARTAHAGEVMRVKGWVRTGTMQWDPATNKLGFELARQDGSGAVPVAFQGILPDMFAEGREVVVEGHDEGSVFRARQVMTSCPSKYEADRKGA